MANPVTKLMERYIERQREKGKSPGPGFFRLPGSGAALANLTKAERERKGISRTTPAKSGPADFSGANKTLSDRKAATDALSQPKSYAKGGMVKKTGMAKVHKGERVMTKSQTKKMHKKG